jgi:tRNA threonylcarbamoyl adenosine modification protein YeaZ
MLILSIDTTSEMGGVGIFRETDCLASARYDGPANHDSVTLFEMLERALAQSQLALSDIELYAVANGPGSFTGIRVGLAAARAWGKVFGKPVRSVSILAALVGKANVTTDWAFPILDGRRGEFFLGCFRRITGAGSGADRTKYEPADAGWVLNPDLVRAFLEERLADGADATCLARAHDSAALALCESLPCAGRQCIEGTLMDSIAAIALREERARVPQSDAQLDAYYIRRPEAEVKWKA